jgi:hypothetical protein
MNLEKTIILKLSRKEEKHSNENKGKQNKTNYRFTYLESMVEKNGMIQN